MPRFLEAIKVEGFRDIFHGESAEPDEEATRRLALHDDPELQELDPIWDIVRSFALWVCIMGPMR